ncbi:uncharacterized protein LOC134240923 [Saccostrea cucullata]|uniref:uncharacterized protein LOC134240923 n=1 Tax=Saccostrea cuccullata TaxID=36930 RepID=UPI002ED39909
MFSSFMISTFLFAGTQVQSLSFKYLSDFIVEGGSSLAVTSEEKSEFVYSLSRECPSTCREGAAFPVSLYTTRDHNGFFLKAEDNDVVDQLFTIRVDVYNKTNVDKSLKILRFTFVDDDEKPLSLTEGLWNPLQVTVAHPPNLPQTEYTFADVLNQEFNKEWERAPLKVVFQENEGGNKTLQINPIDDDEVRDHPKQILVIKRLSTCEPVQRYYQHFAVQVQENDVFGEFTQWSTWSSCTREALPFRDCFKTRTRKCEHIKPNFGGTPICKGNSVEEMPCSSCT